MSLLFMLRNVAIRKRSAWRLVVACFGKAASIGTGYLLSYSLCQKFDRHANCRYSDQADLSC